MQLGGSYVAFQCVSSLQRRRAKSSSLQFLAPCKKTSTPSTRSPPCCASVPAPFAIDFLVEIAVFRHPPSTDVDACSRCARMKRGSGASFRRRHDRLGSLLYRKAKYTRSDAGAEMSIRAMTWAWQKSLSPTPKLLLMALADIADDSGLCWPSHTTLATKCSLTDRTVRRALVLLQRRSLILVERRFKADGSRTSNRYRLAIDTPLTICPGVRLPMARAPVSGALGPRTSLSG